MLQFELIILLSAAQSLQACFVAVLLSHMTEFLRMSMSKKGQIIDIDIIFSRLCSRLQHITFQFLLCNIYIFISRLVVSGKAIPYFLESYQLGLTAITCHRKAVPRVIHIILFLNYLSYQAIDIGLLKTPPDYLQFQLALSYYPPLKQFNFSLG